jgi:pimeloyl-ACP methyl ester carboxylesterase
MPVVFLHGLTFDRTTWRPIIERLGEGVCSVALDLPGHGETADEPCSLHEAAAWSTPDLRRETPPGAGLVAAGLAVQS